MWFLPKMKKIFAGKRIDPSPRTATYDAIEEIRSFFIEITKEQVETIFSSILETCLTIEDPAFDTPEARFELLFTLKKIECLIEAASLL